MSFFPNRHYVTRLRKTILRMMIILTSGRTISKINMMKSTRVNARPKKYLITSSSGYCFDINDFALAFDFA